MSTSFLEELTSVVQEEKAQAMSQQQRNAAQQMRQI